MPEIVSRPTLEADLIRHQHSGDFAAQAETLMDRGHSITLDALN